MNYQEALAFIHKKNNFAASPGLERMQRLCELLGNPQDGMKFVHVAGTNGKGSTVTMIACALEDAGYKVGKYTSPFIYDFRERIEINGKMITEAELCAITEKVSAACSAVKERPTEFEIVTAIAFLYYKEQSCDYVVLETGLGGRLDATNAIKDPLVSVICSISLDHTQILGSTEEAIALEKAGIIKKDCPCAAYPANDEKVTNIFKDICRQRRAPFYMPDISKLNIKSTLNNKCVFEYKGVRYSPAMLGKYQIYNALTAISALEILKIDSRFIASGIGRARAFGRYEIISQNPRIILDVGHNPQGIESLKKAIKNDKKIKNLTVIFGVLKDKNYPFAIREIASAANKIICITPDSPRAMSAAQTAQIAELFCSNCYACDDIRDAVSRALSGLGAGTLLVCGSFFIMDKTVKELKNQCESL